MRFCGIFAAMDLENFRYRGRGVTAEEVEFVRRLVAENPDDSRRALSAKLCEAWNWRQPNGVLRDMVCRGFMLELHRAGHIRLPEKKRSPKNPFLVRKKPDPVETDRTPITADLKELLPLEFRRVRRSGLEGLFDGLVEQYHYLGYCRPVGEHLKYVAFSAGRPVACLAWSSAPRHIGCRDRFIGWSRPERERNLRLIACNVRFLVVPWCRVANLASHVLGRMAGTIDGDWRETYGHGLCFLETFVDTERFRGTCYRAANWIRLGETTGRGKNDQTGRANRSIKAVWGCPLSKDFRLRLKGGGE
jgi:hypothetical protein